MKCDKNSYSLRAEKKFQMRQIREATRVNCQDTNPTYNDPFSSAVFCNCSIKKKKSNDTLVKAVLLLL